MDQSRHSSPGSCPSNRTLIIIPAYNEDEFLKNTLDELVSEKNGAAIVVVDDGSEDHTARLAASYDVRLLRHATNLGYGAALQTGYKYAWEIGADIVIQMDADGQHPADQIPTLIHPIETQHSDLAIGTRFDNRARYPVDFRKRLALSFLRRLSWLYGLPLVDPTSGFQAMNRNVLRLYIQDSFPSDYPDLDVLIDCHRNGIRIGEYPVRMRPSPRPSTLHSGLSPAFYFFRLAILLVIKASPSFSASRRVEEIP